MGDGTRDGIGLAEGMLGSIRGLPQQLERGCDLAAGSGRGLDGIRRVVLCGMGGSAFPGDLLKVYTDPRGVDLRVSRDYVVRDPLPPGTLVIASSFSGNTEETLAALDDARGRGAPVLVLSAGGALETRAREAGLPFVKLEKPTPGFQPRAAMGYFVAALGTILEELGLLSGVRQDMVALAEWLTGLNPASRARALAVELADRIPVVYATHPYVESAARVIKIKLNENAKIPAFAYGVPELNHNEMVGYTRLTGPFTGVLLRDPDVAPRLLRRLDITAATLRDNDVPVVEVPLEGASPLQKLFGVLYLFDFVSCYLAEAAGIDPNPVAMVEDFKARLTAG